MVRTNALRLALAGVLCSVAVQSPAQEWPSRPVKVVVAFSPGGSADHFGRLMASELSAAFKQQFFVENRPGNSGAIGSAQVARTDPDGYTLLIGGSGPHLTGPAINPNIGYDPLKDFTHIALTGKVPLALAVLPSFPAKSVKELIALAKAKPNSINYGSAGAGSSNHSSFR